MPAQRASMHIERAREFLASGANDAAESQFREALIHEPMNAEALSGLARTLQLQGKFAEARYQAIAANRLQPGAEAYLVLARADLHDNNIAEAQQNLQLALNFDPNNQEARNVAQEIQDRAILQPMPVR